MTSRMATPAPSPDAQRARGELRSLLRLERAHHRVRLGAVRHGDGVRDKRVVLVRE
jgi:hypothetical protein